MNFFDKKVLEKLWWYGLNILTTLFIVSFINFNAPQGEPGVPGSNGTNGVDGQDGRDGQDFSGQNLYPVSPLSYDPAPVGDARAAYAAELVEQGFIPLDSVEDFEIFSVSPLGTLENGFYGNAEAYENNYVLTADIDFSGEDVNYFGRRIAGIVMEEFQQNNVGYSGIFDGAGYTIKNFDLAVGEYNYDVGFFPRTYASVIRNINFENHSIKAVLFDGDAGGLIGNVDGRTLIQNVTMTNLEVISDGNSGGLVGRGTDAIYILNAKVNLGTVFGVNNSGGLIGQTDNNYTVFIQDSVNRATIDVTVDTGYFLDSSYIDNAGGFIGEIVNNESTIILNSVNDGLIRSTNEAAGFIGLATYSETLVIANSYNNGLIYSLDSSEAAGLIADLDSPFDTYIQNSYNTAQIYSSNNSGGLVGELGDDYDDDGNSLSDYMLKPLYITNSYNSGTILTTSGDAGGLIAEVNNSRHAVIQNSFNVGKFSLSVSTLELGLTFRENGAIIGDATGTHLLENVVYYVDLDNAQEYLSHAIDDHLDVGASQLNGHDAFIEDAFYFDTTWNFDTLWTFSTTNYPYPVLQDLPIYNLKTGEDEWLPFVDLFDFWGYFSLINEETNENEVFIDGLFVEAGDVDSGVEDLQIDFYISLDNEFDNAQAITESAQLIYESLGFFIEIFGATDGFSFVPNAGSGVYYLYVVITDADGNQAFSLADNSIEYTALEEDNTAPIPGGLGNVVAEFNDFPSQIALDFALATDNVTAQEDLIYYVVIAVDNFDFESWNLVWTNPSIKFANAFSPIGGAPYLVDIEAHAQFPNVTDLEVNVNYDVAVYVQDEAGNLSIYEIASLAYID